MDADLNHVTLTGVLERGPNTRCADHGAQPVSARDEHPSDCSSVDHGADTYENRSPQNQWAQAVW